MSELVTLSVAGLDFAMEYEHPEILEDCRSFLTDRPPRFTLRTTRGEIAAEGRRLPGCSPAYWEFVCLHRALAERLPLYDGMVIHAGAMELGGRAYLFLGPSGIGKTTHLLLWRQCFPEARIINGDKPVLRLREGRLWAFNTPWQGRERLGTDLSAPVEGLCFLSQSRENRIRPLTPEDALLPMERQIYFPKGREAAERFLPLLDRLLTQCPIWALECDATPAAAFLSYQVLTQER